MPLITSVQSVLKKISKLFVCDLTKNELTEEAGDDKEMVQSIVIMQIRKIWSTISPSGIQAGKPKVNSKSIPAAFINKSKGTGLHSIN